MDTCINCFYSRSIDSDLGVACQRYPPMITKVEGSSVTAHFPLVNNGAWCGEHKPAPPKSRRKPS